MLFLLIPTTLAQVTVETYNAGLAYGFVDHAKERRGPITDALQDAEADILCLQEVWEKKDRKRLSRALAEDYPHQFFMDIKPHRAGKAPVCKMKDLFGDGRFVSCMSEQCGDLTGDDKTDCIINECQEPLTALKNQKPECANSLMAQVGKSAPVALWNVISPFRRGALFSYKGSDGLLLFSRVPLVEPKQLDFTDISTLSRRRALTATVEVNGQQTGLLCTHLTANLDNIAPYPGEFASWSKENLAQAERIIEYMPERSILAGDFNCGFAGEGLDAELAASCDAFVEAGFVSQPLEQCSFCADNALVTDDPSEHDTSLIDHIFLRGMQHTTAERTRDEAQGGLPLSDHYGVRAVVDEAPDEAEPVGDQETEVVPQEP